MRLSYQTPTRPGETVWWVAHDPANVRDPIVAIEHRMAEGKSQQIVFSDRGVRTFEYRNGRLASASTPLPGTTAEADIELVRAALRHYQRNPAPSGSEGLPLIAGASIDAIRSTEDIAELLERFWGAAQVKPTVGQTYRRIDTELEYFPHGVLELYEASKAF